MPIVTTPLSFLMHQAIAASQTNDSQTALALFSQACKEEPDSAWPPFLLGAELAQLGRWADAEEAYANAVMIAPALTIARFELGTLQLTSGRPGVAFVTWQPLLDLPATDAFKLFVLGYMELSRDHFDHALCHFKQGMAANTDNSPLNQNIQLLVDGIEKQKISSASSDAAGSAPQASTESHFLLSAYDHGKIH
jgi:tetratricopeptide (TPR) repeat protein